MNIRDLKVGQLLVITDKGNNVESLAIVTFNNKDEICISGPSFYCDINDMKQESMESSLGGYVVERVYSRGHNRLAYKLDIGGRTLLWSRPTAKKMTVAEICEKLGYEVEIVK